ncbi:MAG TPA: NAD(P)H-hydrate dehydratase [Actinomycetota bacterium]|nr:NAD(P)H-hydrate dehydratase [Actinomycetota bacterium]
MKPVVTPAEAAELDRATQERGVRAADLMERAGWAVARACADLLGGTYGRRAVVLCGSGNNGGDGYVAARHLARWGMTVAAVTLRDPAELKGPAAANARRLAAETDARILSFDPGALDRELARADLVVDAVFGTGFHGVAEGEAAAAIEALDASLLPVVAVDIPSGVDGATGAVDGPAVRADLTVTFGAAKIGAVLLPGAGFAGDVRVVDIGFPDDLVPDACGLTEPADVADVLPERAADAHKKASGTLVIVAGSRRMTGAVRLLAQAAGRIGAGYVIVAVPASILPVVQQGLTETVFLPLAETEAGTVAPAARDAIVGALEGAHALAMGPGLSTDPDTRTLIRGVLRESPVPVVLDADGLNAFAREPDLLADRKADAVLTPHLGELARLIDGGPDRLAGARMLAARANAVALVKGSRTAIAAADGGARINPTGTPFLATAGTGDVLTGTIGGLLAAGVAPFDAAWAAAYVHGLAGILAGAELGEGTLAGDVAERLPAAVELVRTQA